MLTMVNAIQYLVYLDTFKEEIDNLEYVWMIKTGNAW